VLTHDVAQGVGIPMAAPEHRLLTPRPWITRRLSPHPASLAPLRPEQPIQGSPSRAAHPGQPIQGSPSRNVLAEAATLGAANSGRDPVFGLTQARRPELQHGIERGSRHRDLRSLLAPNREYRLQL